MPNQTPPKYFTVFFHAYIQSALKEKDYKGNKKELFPTTESLK